MDAAAASCLPQNRAGGAAVNASIATKIELLDMLSTSIEACDKSLLEMETTVATLTGTIAREKLQRARLNHLLNTVRTGTTIPSSD
jgi:hypothetical protein